MTMDYEGSRESPISSSRIFLMRVRQLVLQGHMFLFFSHNGWNWLVLEWTTANVQALQAQTCLVCFGRLNRHLVLCVWRAILQGLKEQHCNMITAATLSNSKSCHVAHKTRNKIKSNASKESLVPNFSIFQALSKPQSLSTAPNSWPHIGQAGSEYGGSCKGGIPQEAGGSYNKHVSKSSVWATWQPRGVNDCRNEVGKGKEEQKKTSSAPLSPSRIHHVETYQPWLMSPWVSLSFCSLHYMAYMIEHNSMQHLFMWLAVLAKMPTRIDLASLECSGQVSHENCV